MPLTLTETEQKKLVRLTNRLRSLQAACDEIGYDYQQAYYFLRTNGWRVETSRITKIRRIAA